MASRKLVVEIVGDARSLERTLGRATRQTRGFSASLGSIARSAAVFGGITAGIAGVGVALRSGIREFADAQKAASQTAAAIKSTGGVANVTAKQVEALATSIQRYSGIDDEAVQSGENLLLTFRNVRNEVGKGNAIFDRATRAAVDLSVRGFGSIESTSKTLGKALQDPVRGMTALRRAGVTFTEAQQNTIKALVKSGDLLAAQKVILREVETQVGGSAKAYGDTLPGQLNKLRESFRNLAGDLVGKVAPGFTRALEGVNDFVDRISQARTTRAKLNIVFEGAETIGRQLFQQITTALRDLLTQLGRVDFGQVGQVVGRSIARALSGVAAFLQSVDWGQVGQVIVRGIIDFLKNVPWRALLIGIVKLQVAAFRAAASLLLGVGKELGKALLNGLLSALKGLGAAVKNVLTRAFDGLVALAIRTALKIIEPFTHIPRRLGGGAFQDIKRSFQTQLAQMETTAQTTATNVNAALGTIQSRRISLSIDVSTGRRPEEGAAGHQGVANPGAVIRGSIEKAIAVAKASVNTALKTAKQAGEAGAKVARASGDAAAKTAKATTDAAKTTRKATDAVTKSTGLIVSSIEKARKAREEAQAALQRSQFRGLGLSATGDALTPTVQNLRRQLTQLTRRLGSDVSPKIAGQLERIGKVLSGKFGKVTEQTRAKIKELFDAIRGGLNQGASDLSSGPLTKTSALNVNKILDGLGLGRGLEKELRSRLSGFNSAGRALAGKPATAATGGFVSPFVVQSHVTVTLDGDVVGRAITRSQQKASRRNPPQRRGPNAR